MKRSCGNGESFGRGGKGGGISGGIREGEFGRLGRECEWSEEGIGDVTFVTGDAW